MKRAFVGVLMVVATFAAEMARATSFVFSTGDPDGQMAMASRPESGSKIEIETADDFILTSQISFTNATFVGLVPAGSTVSGVTVEIYRVFPLDSANPPSGNVPTRVNSPSDVAFDSRDSATDLAFTTAILATSCTAANSVLNGIHKIPNQTTGGEGAVSSQEVQFNITFTTPLTLERCIKGVTRNPSEAIEAVVPFDPFLGVFPSLGDVLGLKVSTRIGTNLDGTKCVGPGGSHNNAAGLRLYYDSVSRESRFDATVSPSPTVDVFLHSDGNACANAPSTGVTTRSPDANAPVAANAKCKDSGGLHFAGGNPFSEIGTWSATLPLPGKRMAQIDLRAPGYMAPAVFLQHPDTMPTDCGRAGKPTGICVPGV